MSHAELFNTSLENTKRSNGANLRAEKWQELSLQSAPEQPKSNVSPVFSLYLSQIGSRIISEAQRNEWARLGFVSLGRARLQHIMGPLTLDLGQSDPPFVICTDVTDAKSEKGISSYLQRPKHVREHSTLKTSRSLSFPPGSDFKPEALSRREDQARLFRVQSKLEPDFWIFDFKDQIGSHRSQTFLPLCDAVFLFLESGVLSASELRSIEFSIRCNTNFGGVILCDVPEGMSKASW